MPEVLSASEAPTEHGALALPVERSAERPEAVRGSIADTKKVARIQQVGCSEWTTSQPVNGRLAQFHIHASARL
jgi:hypothetical protein